MNNTIEILQSEVNQKVITGFSFHTKFFAILGIISGAFSCILGIPLLLFFGFGLIYIGIGAGLIYLSIQLLKTSAIAKSISTAITNDEEITQEDLNQKMMSIISGIKLQFKVYNILIMIEIGLLILVTVGMAIAISMSGNSLNSGMMNNFGTQQIDQSMMQNNYKSNRITPQYSPTNRQLNQQFIPEQTAPNFITNQ